MKRNKGILNKSLNVLGYMYYSQNPEGVSKEELLNKLKISKKGFNEVKEFLFEKDAMTEIISGPRYKITKRGIDFFNQERYKKSQKEFSRIIALTGAIVALVYFYNFIVRIMGGKFQAILSIIFLIPLVLAFVPIVKFIWREFSRK